MSRLTRSPDRSGKSLPWGAATGGLTRRFGALHGGQVAMLWVGWALLWWGLRIAGLATSGTAADIWIALFLAVSFIGGALLFALTWAWFEARREL